MKLHILWNHTMVLASFIAGIAGMGMVFDAVSHGNLHELSFGVPALFIGLWWAGRELGQSILASRARSVARRSTARR